MKQLRILAQGKLVGVAVCGVMLTSACGQSVPQSQAAPGVPVRVAEVKRTTLEESSEFVGTLEARQRAVLRPRIEGQILQILVRNGDRVEKGAPLVQLQPKKNQAEVNAAISNVNARRAVLSNARSELNAAIAEVRRSQADVERQKAEIQRQDAEVKLAQIEFERSESLVSSGVLPKQDLDNKRRDRETAQATLTAQQQTLSALQAALKAAQERVDSARATLDRENAEVARAEAQVNVVSQDLEFNRVVAPISGAVGDIPVKVGETVDPDDTLTTIIQNSALDLRLAVPVERTAQLRLGVPVELLLGSDRAVKGNISFISPEVDREAQVILAKATFRNNGSLRDGQSVRARAIWERKPGVLIPVASVSRIGGQSFVFIAQKGEPSPGEDPQGAVPQTIAKQKPVTLGDIQGQEYQVLKGLNVGDRIVVEGVLKLSDGTPINPAGY